MRVGERRRLNTENAAKVIGEGVFSKKIFNSVWKKIIHLFQVFDYQITDVLSKGTENNSLYFAVTSCSFCKFVIVY